MPQGINGRPVVRVGGFRFRLREGTSKGSLPMKKRLGVLITLLILAGTNALRGADPDAQWFGVLWTKGMVSVGDATVSSRATVVPRDVITTYEGASAWVRFRSPASAILLADTQVVLLASDTGPSFLLRQGTMVVDEKTVDPVQVTVPGGFVLVKGDPQTGGECEMATVGNDSTVSVKRGQAEIHAQGEPVIVHAGQSVRVEAGPQGGQGVAGKVNRVIPQGVIKKEGQIQELPLKQNAVINWNDLVRTLQVGRAQILLLDGSTLNVGARSTIKILKHDPQAQQTEIELTLGQVQADVRKITATGGKFEIHTKSAVIGTIDTSFIASADDKQTTVCGRTGVTTVKSSDPKNPKVVKLHRKECTKVIFGGIPTDPVFDPAQFASLASQTGVEAGTLGPAAVAGIAGGVAGGGAGIAAIVLATAGTTSPTSP
jgi:ferric-dicitrate binding protein FerR (iron transport regulator)